MSGATRLSFWVLVVGTLVGAAGPPARAGLVVDQSSLVDTPDELRVEWGWTPATRDVYLSTPAELRHWVASLSVLDVGLHWYTGLLVGHDDGGGSVLLDFATFGRSEFGRVWEETWSLAGAGGARYTYALTFDRAHNPHDTLIRLTGLREGPPASPGGVVDELSAVPEPSTLALGLAGLACAGGLALLRRRRPRPAPSPAARLK